MAAGLTLFRTALAEAGEFGGSDHAAEGIGKDGFPVSATVGHAVFGIEEGLFGTVPGSAGGPDVSVHPSVYGFATGGHGNPAGIGICHG